MQQHNVDPSDSALVSAARAGDREAFAVLFIRHRPTLIAVCRRWRGAAVPVEDVLQEAAVQALLNLDRLRQPERFGAWLTGIGLNICRRWSRESRRSALSWDDLVGGRLGPEPVESTAGPEALAEAALTRDAVRQSIVDLPPR